MPRIRYLKSRDFKLYEDDEENDDNGESRENSTGNSWLSNAVIASQLSESKIKAAIAALKAQIRVLETELLSRRLNNSNQSGRNWDKIGTLCGPEDGEKLYPRVDRRNGSRKNKTFQKVASLRRTLSKLGVKDVDSLLAEWSKITGKDK